MSDWPQRSDEMAARIRTHDWTTTPLGPIGTWSERLKLMVEQVLANPLVSSLVCRPERVLIYNAAALYGDRHPAALGRPLPEAFPEGWATVAPFYARAFAGETVQVAGQPLDTRGEGEATDVFDAVLTPVREADGRIAFVHMTGFEIGARTRAEAALRESEARHRLLIESWAQAVWETDAAGVVVADSPSWRAYTGQTLEEWLGYGWLDAIHPDDRAYAERQWREAVLAQALVDAEFRLRAPGGGWRWTNVRAAPMRDAEGRIEKWLGLNIDIDERKQAEAALRESEERQAYLLALSDALRPLAEQEEIQAEAMRLLGERLGVNRAQYYIADETGEYLSSSGGYTNGIPAAIGRFRLVEFGQYAYDGFHAGETQVVCDARTDPRISEAVLRSYETVGFLAYIGVPFVQRGRLVGTVAVHQSGPRPWTDSERMMVEETALRAGLAVAQARAELALRESEERQAFLLKLSDALRPVSDPVMIQDIACRILGEHLRLDWTQYSEIDVERGTISNAGNAYRGDLQGHVGVHDLKLYPVHARAWGAGRSLAIDDVEADIALSQGERTGLLTDSVRATLTTPLIKDGAVVAVMAALSAAPRAWTADDIALLEETADRTWAAVERARAEARLRESEERFSQSAASSADGLWIRDADTLAMEYVSPAIQAIYGVPRDAILGDPKHWAALILPEDREAALTHLEQAKAGEAVAHEFRIERPSDGALRWIRNTEFPLHDAHGRVQRIGGIAQDVTDAKRASERLTVLVNELQHRSRNLLGVVTSMANRTVGRGASAESFLVRLKALSRAQALLSQSGSDTVAVEALVRAELAAHADNANDRIVIGGPAVALTSHQVQNFALALHELTTNAVKYGALKNETGRLSVTWESIRTAGGRNLALTWVETCVDIRPGTVTRRGYGRELIEQALAYALGGRTEYVLDAGGVRCRIELPVV